MKECIVLHRTIIDGVYVDADSIVLLPADRVKKLASAGLVKDLEPSEEPAKPARKRKRSSKA